MRKVAFVGAKFTTIDCMRRLLEDGFGIDQLITIGPEEAKKSRVSGYMDVGAFARANGIPVLTARRYDLRDEIDISTIRTMELDLLLVIGWERLIPKEILQSAKLFACGMHGSPEGLPRGRGRSPLNWSLILGKRQFITSLFIYDENVDSGRVIASEEFEIAELDDAETLHLKNRIAMNKLLRTHLPSILRGEVHGLEQRRDMRRTYYPKRTPDDGGIDWGRRSIEIRNLVRALARPYPGAFTWLGDRKVVIWSAVPFDERLVSPGQPGEIVELTVRGSFVVSTGDGALLVRDYEGIAAADVEPGVRFTSVDFRAQLASILARYPEFVAEDQREITEESFGVAV